MKYAKYPLVFAPWPFAAWLILGMGANASFWPFLLLACALAAFWDWRAAAVLALGVLLVQIPKAEFIPLHQWVYWAAIYLTLGVVSILAFSIVSGITAIFVGLAFLTFYAGLPEGDVHTLTELVFMIGLLVAVYRGDGGSIIRAVLRPAHQSPMGRSSFGLIGAYRRRLDRGRAMAESS